MSLLTMKNVSYAYEKEEMVLQDITFQAEAGESIGIIGANGIGKSTLMKLLVGLCTNYKGEIQVDHISVEKQHMNEIREKIGYVFQDSENQLFMSSVYQDVAFAPENYGYSAEEVKKRVDKALQLVGISELKDKQIYKLSGGEKKLAAIATILSMEPKMMLMDEPSVALDPRNRRNLISILNELSPLKLIASHDLDFILDTCQRTILMNHGTIIADGDSKRILKDKKLLEENGLELPLRYYYQ